MKVIQKGTIVGLIVGIISIAINIFSKIPFLPDPPTLIWSSFLVLLITTLSGLIIFYFFDKLKFRKNVNVILWIIYWILTLALVGFNVFWILITNLTLSLAP